MSEETIKSALALGIIDATTAQELFNKGNSVESYFTVLYHHEDAKGSRHINMGIIRRVELGHEKYELAKEVMAMFSAPASLDITKNLLGWTNNPDFKTCMEHIAIAKYVLGVTPHNASVFRDVDISGWVPEKFMPIVNNSRIKSIYHTEFSRGIVPNEPVKLLFVHYNIQK